jgi:hypothetical protein
VGVVVVEEHMFHVILVSDENICLPTHPPSAVPSALKRCGGRLGIVVDVVGQV